MHEVVEARRPEIGALCRRLGVRRLEVFGSAAGTTFNTESSDVDVLVEFQISSRLDRFDVYFALKEGLEQILECPVDVVTITAIRNPYFLEEVMRTRATLYAV